MLDLKIEYLQFIVFIIWVLNALIGGVLLLTALLVVWRLCAAKPSNKP